MSRYRNHLLLCIFLLCFCKTSNGLQHDSQFWEDERGERIRIGSYVARHIVTTMAYSRCKKICPEQTFRTLQAIANHYAKKHESYEVFVVSFDPDFDKPKILTDLKRRIAPNDSHWHFLRGTKSQTRDFAKSLGLGGYWKDEDHVIHSYRIKILTDSTIEDIVDDEHEFKL